jgi:hypothetical protein
MAQVESRKKSSKEKGKKKARGERRFVKSKNDSETK